MSVDRESSAVLGQTLGDMADTDEEEQPQPQEQEQASLEQQQTTDKLSSTSAFDASTASEAKLKEVLARLEIALKEEKRAGAAIEALASQIWAKEAPNANNPPEFLSPLLSRFSRSRMPLEVKKASLDLTREISKAWECAQLRKKITDIDDNYSVTTEWSAAFHKSEEPDIVIALKFMVLQHILAPSLPATVSNLEVAFRDSKSECRQLVLPLELAPLSLHCRRCLQPNDALTAFDKYLNKSRVRSETMNKQGRSVKIAEGQAGLTMVLTNDNTVELCQAEWRLTFREDRIDFVDEYFVQFTPEGKKSAESFNFPEALLSMGRCREWTAEYCIRNLETMASLDDNGGEEDSNENQDQEQEEEGESNAKRPRRSSGARASDSA